VSETCSSQWTLVCPLRSNGCPLASVLMTWLVGLADKDGTLSLEELKEGFKKDLKIEGDLPKQVLACLETNFAAWAPDGQLKKEIFCRLYAEVLFAFFDEDKNGTLELAEAQKVCRPPHARYSTAHAHALLCA
jgi:hypothetical protein